MKENVSYDFTGEVAMITGAASGIGKAVTRAFAEAGATVILVDIDSENLTRMEAEFESILGKDRFLALHADVAKQTDIETMVSDALARFAKIDILFNNAGVNRRGHLKDVTREDYRYVMGVNLDGKFWVAQTVGKTMIEAGKGKIVNTASMSSFIVNKKRYNGIYCISKAAVGMMTKVMAAEWAEYGINVNAIAPGYTKTPMNKGFEDPQVRRPFEETVPLNRLADPEEMVGAVLFLASPAASYITGHTVLIDGGHTIW